MWIIADYQPTTLFSLRPATATTSGGKSLIVPTPFAIKMALLDVAVRTRGVRYAESSFPALRDMRIAIDPPPQIVVNSTFTKILRIQEHKGKASEKAEKIVEAKSEQEWPFKKTIAYREYVQLVGPLQFGFKNVDFSLLVPLLLQVNYLGKRGGFLQLQATPYQTENLPSEFTEITESVGDSFPLGMLQQLDDFGPKITYEHANIYSGKSMRLGTHRILRPVILPYRTARSSRGYTLYERFDQARQ